MGLRPIPEQICLRRVTSSRLLARSAVDSAAGETRASERRGTEGRLMPGLLLVPTCVVVAGALERPMMAEIIQISETCGKVARLTPPNVILAIPANG